MISSGLCRFAISSVLQGSKPIPQGGPLQRGRIKPITATNDALWATPDESWTTRDLVGGETVLNGELVFKTGWVLRAIKENRWLVLDEANRADMDRIFGGLLTWLSGNAAVVGTSTSKADAASIEIGWTSRPECLIDTVAEADVTTSPRMRYLAGSNWRLLGTYNALDAQRVFRFGAALGRRFVRVPVPSISAELFAHALEDHANDLPSTVLKRIVDLYRSHFEDEATRLGPALFIAMCRYIRIAATYPTAESLAGSSDDHNTAFNEALVEAYVTHVGTWLAQMESGDFQRLKDSSVATGVFTEDDWYWITSMLEALS